MSTSSLLSSGKAGLVLATALFTLTSCDPYMGMAGGGYGGGYGSGYGGGYGNGFGGYGYPNSLSAYAPRGNSYNYSYYPRYGAYYHRPTQQYHYMSGNQWTSGSRLPGFSHSTVQSSHSVPFNFNNHPSNYHSQVSHAYPHTWTPSNIGGSHGGSGGHNGGWSGGGNNGGGHYGHH